MTVRDILAEVALVAEGVDLSQIIINNQEASDVLTKSKVDTLLNCYNAVLRDVAVNYVEIVSSMVIPSSQTDLTSVAPDFLKLIDVTDEKGNAIDYQLDGNKIKVDAPSFMFSYRSIPFVQDIDDLFKYSRKIIGKESFVYGTLAEYYLRIGCFEEAINWENRYRQSVEIRTDYKRRRFKVSKRWGL